MMKTFTRGKSAIPWKVPEIPARRPHGPEAFQHPPLLAPEARAEARRLWLRPGTKLNKMLLLEF